MRYCDVVAEIDGVVTRRNVNPGNNVVVGQSLMAIRSLTEIWVDANFKETQLADLRIGQPVDLDVDMYGSRQMFKGRISGFTMGTGSTLALLPPENATGNFVKVVQRLPVRIELLDYDPDKMPLFIGLSVTPRCPHQGSSRPGRTRAKSSSRHMALPKAANPRRSSNAVSYRDASLLPVARARGSARGSSRSPSSSRPSWRCSTRRSPTSRCATSPADSPPPVTDSEWVITSYLAANAIILPISGWLAIRLGRRELLSALDRHLHARVGAVRHGDEPGRADRLPRAAGPGRRRTCSRRARAILLDAFPPEKAGRGA